MAYVQQASKHISQDLAANLINYTPNLSRGQIGFEVGVHWAALRTGVRGLPQLAPVRNLLINAARRGVCNGFLS